MYQNVSLCARVCVCLFSLTKLHLDINVGTEWEEIVNGSAETKSKWCLSNECVATHEYRSHVRQLFCPFAWQNSIFISNILICFSIIIIIIIWCTFYGNCKYHQPPQSMHTEFSLCSRIERCTLELSRCCDMHVNPNQQIRNAHIFKFVVVVVVVGFLNIVPSTAHRWRIF